MSAALTPAWSADQFLLWAARQEGRYEFDGRQPVAMTGGTARHNRITTNIHAALRPGSRGSACSCYGPDPGVQTAGDRIRFPDALITCTRFPDTARLAPDVVVVFEVLRPESGRRDRIENVREHAAVPSILTHVMVESDSSGLLVPWRATGDAPVTALTLTVEDELEWPGAGVRRPVAAFYEDVEVAASDSARPMMDGNGPEQ